MAIDISGVTLETPKEAIKRFSLLLWGPPKAGKTTLASTAPKDILWLNFDPDGIAAISDVKGIQVMDFAPMPNKCVEEFKVEDPLKLGKFFTENEHMRTVVVDSITSFRDKALPHGVHKAQGTTKGRSSTLENPGYDGYGNLNTWVRLMVKNLLYITAVHKRNIIFIAHEDKPERDKEGVVLYITMMLGGSLVTQVPKDLSEIWALEDTGKLRRIAIRPSRFRKPLGTRMFLTNTGSEFVWDYDAITQKGEGIATWYEQWMANDGKKIPLPVVSK